MQQANQRIRDEESSARYCNQNLEDVKGDLQSVWLELGATRRELRMTKERQTSRAEEQMCKQDLENSRREEQMCKQELEYRKEEGQICREELDNRREQVCPEDNGTEQQLQTQLQEKERQMRELQQMMQRLEADVLMKNSELQKLRDEMQQLEQPDEYEDHTVPSVVHERMHE